MKYGRIRERRSCVINTDLVRLLESHTASEALEIQQYLCDWEAGTYDNVAQSVLDHAERKGFSPLRYLRKAHNFNRKGATRIPRWSTTDRRSSGYRQDNLAVYRKGGEFLIVRPDSFGVDKIVTYGINED